MEAMDDTGETYKCELSGLLMSATENGSSRKASGDACCFSNFLGTDRLASLPWVSPPAVVPRD